MTVCIAAACEHGELIVTCTDGMLSTEAASGDIVPGKMLWYGPWQFMYAGSPANFAMIKEEIVGLADPAKSMARANVLRTVRRAYRAVCSRFSSAPFLDPLDMTMDELKRVGLKTFGAEYCNDLLRQISHRANEFNEQVILTGWGHSPHSALIYEIGPAGESIHESSGFAAIGSGAQMAQTTLLLLEQARHRSIAETIFNVACAKFSAERSLGVGKMTAMNVSGKSPDGDTGRFVSFEDLAKLRTLWERHLKPRIPSEARVEIVGIAGRLRDGSVSWRDAIEAMKAEQERCQSSSSTDQT